MSLINLFFSPRKSNVVPAFFSKCKALGPIKHSSHIILFSTIYIVDILYVSDSDIIHPFMVYLSIRFFTNFMKFFSRSFLKKIANNFLGTIFRSFTAIGGNLFVV